ncbi:MAG: M48 family metallopeptidase [Eubacterium sp.]|nr:M48 family metallopeptidase [Eubacterium sp.]MCI8918469.1 M48 family metallopeptidase [Eubacterium sp.]
MEPEKIESEFAYTLIRKNVKNINLTVKSDGSIVVSANPRVDERYIEDFISSKIPFIKKAREKLAQSKTNEKVSYESGSRIPYLGGFLTLQTAQADRRLVPEWIAQLQDGRITSFSRNNHGEAVFCRDGQLFMYAESGRDAAYRQQLFESWQKIQAGVLCGQLSRKYYPQFQKLGVVYPQIKIRKMSSRWGSCMPGKHKITFNSLLLEKPLESIEYVVVHEFAHFIHPDHSKAFYAFVGQILPDWKERREKL